MTDREEYREALVEAFRVVAAKMVTRLDASLKTTRTNSSLTVSPSSLLPLILPFIFTAFSIFVHHVLGYTPINELI